MLLVSSINVKLTITLVLLKVGHVCLYSLRNLSGLHAKNCRVASLDQPLTGIVTGESCIDSELVSCKCISV